ncbi:MAG: hypothetical protein IKV86_06355 [Clostridia bacterium]|nr:hypothetical protein [Clostridia bacterium]
MKNIIGFIMLIIGMIGAIANGVYSMYLRFANPDMTETRLLYEYPEVLFYMIIAGVVMFVGRKLAENK